MHVPVQINMFVSKVLSRSDFMKNKVLLAKKYIVSVPSQLNLNVYTYTLYTRIRLYPKGIKTICHIETHIWNKRIKKSCVG